MNWGQEIAYFFGGVFLANSFPHAISGLMGRAFQSPFAKPPGEGYSGAVTNVLWGFLNLIAAYYLLMQVGSFDLHNAAHAGALGLGMFLMGLYAARHFGKFNGGGTGTFS